MAASVFILGLGVCQPTSALRDVRDSGLLANITLIRWRVCRPAFEFATRLIVQSCR